MENKARKRPVNVKTSSEDLAKELENQRIELETQVGELQQAQHNLEQSRDKYQSLYDSIPAGYFTLDKENRILEANLTGAEMLGIERRALEGTDFRQYLAPESQEGYHICSRRAFSSGEQSSCELVILKNDGQKISVRLGIARVKDTESKSPRIRVIMVDITETKKIQAELQFTRQEFSELLNSIPIPVSITSFPEEIIVDANTAFINNSGFPRAEIIGGKGPELPWKDQSEANQIACELDKYGRIDNKEIHLFDKLGELHTSILSARKIKLGGKDHIISASLDITSRKNIEEALRASEAFNASLLANSPNPIQVINPDGSIRYVNPAMEKLTGFSSAEAVGQKVPYPWWPPEKVSEYEESWQTVQDVGTGLGEWELVKKSGERFCVVTSIRRVQEAGETRYFVSNWVDITQRKKAEDQIKYNEAQLRSIMDALAEGVSLIDTSGNMVRINKAEAALFGLSAEDQNLGVRFRNPDYQHIYTNGNLIPIEESSVITALKRKRAIRNLEVGVVKDDSSVVWLNVSAVPVINEAGKVVGVVRTSMDITEQKMMQDEREQFTRRLLEAQEEERKRISRELHDDTAQYLALLKLEMDSLIEKERIHNPQTVERLEQLRVTADKALNEVRRFSHELRPSVLEHFGLTSALELIIGEFRNACPTEVNFNVHGQEKRLTDDVELALFRITQEALSNIRKHAEASTAEVHLKFTPRKVRLTIADNGKGFIVGKKSEPGGKGSLGLVGMRERAHLIGADLKIRSKPRAGTIIYVDLPVP